MDLMDDDDLRNDVLKQMMGEVDDVTADSLRKPKGGSGGGVAITISVEPKSGDEMKEELEEAGACTDPDCEDPMHDHAKMKAEDPGDYISQLIKKLG